MKSTIDVNLVITTAITVLTLVGYPIAGLIEAYRKKETIRIKEFAKTIVINLGLLGALNTANVGMVNEFLGTAIFGILIDKMINASTRDFVKIDKEANK